jgi:hypothetical protein
LREVQLDFDEVDHLIVSRFKSYLRIIGQGPTYWRMARITFEGSGGSFRAHQRPFAQYYTREFFLKLLGDTPDAINT